MSREEIKNQCEKEKKLMAKLQREYQKKNKVIKYHDHDINEFSIRITKKSYTNPANDYIG